MFCPECGCRNDDNSKFCVSCGAPLTMFAQPAPPAYSPAPAVKPQKSGNGIAAAISAIITFLMFFLPWLSVWGYSMSYFDMMDVSGDLGWVIDGADTFSTVLIFCMIVFFVLAIITIVKGFKGKTGDCGIAAGIIGICMVLALAIAMEFELEYMGVGAYLFLASSVVLIILSSKK